MEKKKNRNTWLWVILCLPMVFIIYYAITLSGTDIKTEEVSLVTVTLPDGTEYSFDEYGDIDFYVNMYLEADPLTAPLRDISEEEPLTVLLTRTDGSFEYKLYPEVNTNGCFYTNSNGECFSILSDDAKQLLQRAECAYIYGNNGYGLPRLSFVTADTEELIAPSEYAWQYKDIAGATVDYTGTATADEQLFSYYSNKSCAFRFSVEPDRCSVSFAYENGDKIDCDSPAELSFASDTTVVARVEAFWNERDKILGGSAVYEFELLYDVIPSSVRRPAETVMVGDVIYASFRNLNATETIMIETTLKTSEGAKTSVIYDRENGYTHIMLPVSLDNTAGDYELKFYVGDVIETFNIQVKTPEYSFISVSKDTGKYTDFVSEAVRNEYKGLMADWLATDSAVEVTTDEAFALPTNGEVLYDFGSTVTVNSLPYVFLDGIDYEVSEDSLIRATKNGTVVYIAEDDEYYGNMVVIDHGNGILSHYYHLGKLADGLTVGSIVREGETIATGGGSGLVYNHDGAPTIFHFAISLNGIYVNPNAFFESGINLIP